MRPRYYCDHCNKGTGSASFMRRHERGCTNNPQRVCRMCELAYNKQPAQADLLKLLDTEGFAAMCEAASQCPACILATLRQRHVRGEFGGYEVSGPEDGRQAWSYTKAKQDWWDGHNVWRAEREHPEF